MQPCNPCLLDKAQKPDNFPLPIIIFQLFFFLSTFSLPLQTLHFSNLTPSFLYFSFSLAVFFSPFSFSLSPLPPLSLSHAFSSLVVHFDARVNKLRNLITISEKKACMIFHLAMFQSRKVKRALSRANTLTQTHTDSCTHWHSNNSQTPAYINIYFWDKFLLV